MPSLHAFYFFKVILKLVSNLFLGERKGDSECLVLALDGRVWFRTCRVEVQHCIDMRMLKTFTCTGLFVGSGDVEFDGGVIFL